MLLYYFFYTHILINMYICCVFFFLNCLILLMFPVVSLLFFGMKVGLQVSPEAQFSYQKGRESLMCFTVCCSLALFFFPLCTLKQLLFSVFCSLLWELRFKSLTNVFVCWTVETSRLSADVAQSCAVTHRHGSFYVVLWDLTVSPHRSGVPRTQGADPPPHLSLKKIK